MKEFFEITTFSKFVEVADSASQEEVINAFKELDEYATCLLNRLDSDYDEKGKNLWSQISSGQNVITTAIRQYELNKSEK